MNILLVEPYFGGSHQAWANGYAAHSAHSVSLLTLPARFWKWRMQGGAVTLAEKAGKLEARPDLILASDMLNLPAFLGLTRDSLAEVPVALYCHENQLTYPLPPGDKRDLTYGMINWISMLAADRVFFNSQFHIQSWFDEVPRLLKHFPEFTHVHRVAEVRSKAAVLPVGCDLRRLDTASIDRPRPGDQLPVVLWNQRWEYDKDPEMLFRALYRLADEGVDFGVILAGKSHRQSAPEFDAARHRLGPRVIHYGYASASEYPALLERADVVLSTAIHEFFGVAIVEAVYSGCFPVLPRRLAYPEIIPSAYHGVCMYDGFDDLVLKLRRACEDVSESQTIAGSLRHEVAAYDWSVMGPRYDEAMAEVADGG